MKQKLRSIYRPWRRFLVSSLLSALAFLSDLQSTRSQCHWIGPRRRARRAQRKLTVLLFLAAMVLLEPREYATWSAIFGGFTAMIVPVLAVFRLLPRNVDE